MIGPNSVGQTENLFSPQLQIACLAVYLAAPAPSRAVNGAFSQVSSCSIQLSRRVLMDNCSESESDVGSFLDKHLCTRAASRSIVHLQQLSGTVRSVSAITAERRSA